MQPAPPKLFKLSLALIMLLGLILSFGSSARDLIWGYDTSHVPVVTASDIRALQSDANGRDDFVIVDVRSEDETSVSMIPGALTISEFERTSHLHQGKAIFVYCTIGVRSGNYAASLIENGWQAWNYKGSILDWCQHNLPLVANGRETNRVHTYSWRFSAPQNYTQVL